MVSEAGGRRAPSLRRIPSLDGLRAVSILLVLLQHTVQRYGLHHPVGWKLWAVSNGAFGVYIFFVISGYLITSLLLHERETRGSISLRGFYLRRFFRIFPPLYVYVGLIVLLGFLGRIAVTRTDILSALFFFHNYGPTGSSWALEHFWSLSVEEQFYLIWPLVLVWSLRRPGDAGRWRAAKIACVVIAISPIVRVAAVGLHSPAISPFLHAGTGFHMRADSLMFGCVAALLEGRSSFERIYRAATRVWWLPLGVIVLCDVLETKLGNRWDFTAGFTLTGAAIMMFLLWTVRNPQTRTGRFLNSGVVAHVGVLSYSIYLWQTLFLHGSSVAIFGGQTIFNTFPGNWIAILVVAEISFYVVERPSMRLRNWLMGAFHLYRERRRSISAEGVSSASNR